MGIEDLERLAQSYGLAVAVLMAGGMASLAAVVSLYRETRKLHDKLERVLEARVEALEALLGRVPPRRS